MSINASEKEYILSLAILKDKQMLEQAVVLKFDQLKLEQTHGRHKIDLMGICQSRRLEFFVEAQINPSDVKHLNHNILSILQSIREGILIWITASFQHEHLAA